MYVVDFEVTIAGDSAVASRFTLDPSVTLTSSRRSRVRN